MIDDLEGRDMPLLRAEVGSLDMTHESGPGMTRYFYVVFTLGRSVLLTKLLFGCAAAAAAVMCCKCHLSDRCLHVWATWLVSRESLWPHPYTETIVVTTNGSNREPPLDFGIWGYS